MCCGAMLVYAVYIGAISVLLPAIGATFGFGSAVGGRLFPATFTGFVSGVILCGYLSDRFGRKAVLLLGTAVYALGLVLFGCAKSFDIALMASLLVGSGSGAMETVAAALAADLYPERRPFILNGIQIAFGVGAASSPSFTHHLLTSGVDWRTCYYALAAVNGLMFVTLLIQRLPRGTGAGEALNFGNLRAVFKQPAFILLCAANLLYVGTELGFFSWMPSYFKLRLPGGPPFEGLVVTVFWIAMTIGRIVTTLIVGRTPILTLICTLAGSAALFSALALVWMSPVAVLCFVGLTGLCLSGIFSLILSEAGERYPDIAGTVFGVVMAIGGVGGAVTPWVVGLLAETALGWRGALLMIPASATGVLLLAACLTRVPRGKA